MSRPPQMREWDKMYFWRRVNIKGPNECWDWQDCHNNKGYGQIKLDGIVCQTHVVAFFLATGNWLSNEAQCLHSCDRPICNNPAHLSEGTNKENSRQMVERGRANKTIFSRGQSHYASKLSQEQVDRVRSLIILDPKMISEMPEFRCVSMSQTSRILRRENWKP